MAWNDQNLPVSGPGPTPAYGQTPPTPNPMGQVPPAYVSAPMPPSTPAPAGQSPVGYGPNPIVAGQPGAAGIQPAPPAYVGEVQPQPGPASQPNVPPAAGQMPRPVAMLRPAAESDRPDAGDDIWIERTKRAIAETQNDPHRQVQLLQHLNKLYLKERFGREVQADKG